jgi:hypothetical protein
MKQRMMKMYWDKNHVKKPKKSAGPTSELEWLAVLNCSGSVWVPISTVIMCTVCLLHK